MSAKQWVAIDDGDARIQYEGNWFSATPDRDINGLGNFGTPFQNTLHGINENGNLTFTFTGSAVNILGTARISRVGGVQDPSYQCFLDGETMGINPPLLFPENNWSLCSINGLAVGQHTLRVQATVDKLTFWVDRLQYVPANDSEFDKQLNYLENDHPSVQYGPGWGDLRGMGNVTHTSGAKARISFTGRSLAWYGMVPDDYPIEAAAATFSIDGGDPQSFLLNGLPSSSSMDQYNQLFFQTPQLPPGDHTIEVVYNGNSNQTPLTIDYFIVQREGAVVNTDTSVPTPTPTPTPLLPSANPSSPPPVIVSSGSVIFQTQTVTSTSIPTASQTNSRSAKKAGPPVGAIVGGSIGGVVFLTLLAWLCVAFSCGPRRSFRRRQRLSRPGLRPPMRTPTLPVISPPSLRPPLSVAATPSTNDGRASVHNPSLRIPPQSRINPVLPTSQDGRSVHVAAQGQSRQPNLPPRSVQDGRSINIPRSFPIILTPAANPPWSPTSPTSPTPLLSKPPVSFLPFPPNSNDLRGLPPHLRPQPRATKNPFTKPSPFASFPTRVSPSQTSPTARNPHPNTAAKGRPQSTARQASDQDGSAGPSSPASMDGYNPPHRTPMQQRDSGMKIHVERIGDLPPRYSAS